MSLDKEIFSGKTLSDLFSEIHDNSTNTRVQVKALIGELKPLVENVGDATLIVPMIKEYMEIGVKNDEQLIKLMCLYPKVIERPIVINRGMAVIGRPPENVLKIL